MSVTEERQAAWVHLWRWLRALGVALAMIPSTMALTKEVLDGELELTEEGPRRERH